MNEQEFNPGSADSVPPPPLRNKSKLVIAWRELKTAPLSAQFGLLIIVFYIVVALFAPILAPYGESEIVGPAFDQWSEAHPMGTDDLGRDMLSRLIYGARNTVGIALITTLFAFLLGGILGILSAVSGGWKDQIMCRLVDVMMAIPALIFAMLLLTIFGISVTTLIIIIGLLDSTRVFRISRAASQNVVVMDYIEFAKLRGEGVVWISLYEVLPNIVPILVAEFGLRFCFVFLTISALNFLGVGLQPPAADWGSMVRDNATLIAYGDITPLLPAAAIVLLTVGVNFVVDWFLRGKNSLQDEN